MKKKSAILCMLLSTCLVSPGMAVETAKAPKYPEAVSQLIDETKRSIKAVDLEGFKKVLDSKSYDLIVDVREPGEFATGHIPGAINVPRGVAEFKIWRHVGFPDNTDYDKNIYLYCKGSARSALATKSLQDLGFSNLTNVDMKLKDWAEKGYPLAR